MIHPLIRLLMNTPTKTAQFARPRRPHVRALFLLIAVSAPFIAGCGKPKSGPIVIYLEGAGWFGSSGSVEGGLRDAGYHGEFSNFTWSAFLGPAHDHLVAAKSKAAAKRLAERISTHRRANPNEPIHVMGLSAGTSLILLALPMLPKDVQVDNVVLFSPSVSSEHNLVDVMEHVKRNLYATSSPHDGILSALPVNADGQGGAPAGRSGFKLPPRAKEGTLIAYSRVINIPWQASFLGFDWNGSHTSVTNRRFVGTVIGPRIMATEPYPLDRSVLDKVAAKPAGARS